MVPEAELWELAATATSAARITSTTTAIRPRLPRTRSRPVRDLRRSGTTVVAGGGQQRGSAQAHDGTGVRAGRSLPTALSIAVSRW